MKNSDNQSLLAHKRAFDAKRQAAAIAKRKELTDNAINKIRSAK